MEDRDLFLIIAGVCLVGFTISTLMAFYNEQKDNYHPENKEDMFT